MATRRAWVLNLDADIELGAVTRYEPRSSVRAAMRVHIHHLAPALLAPGDLLVDEASTPGCARGLAGRAFCPTPRAIAVLTRAGAEPEPSPDVDVLRRVNGRGFATALGPTLPGAAFVTDEGAARAILGTRPAVGNAWRVKHAHGMAGRNQRVLAPDAHDPRDLAFLQTGLRTGGVQIEPNVDVVDEYALHGMLAPDGALRVGSLVRQRCDARGAWVATEPIKEPLEALFEVPVRMNEEVALVGRALHEAGYFGPFGVDAYTYRDREGHLRLQPRSEINARYSMGFAVGFAGAPAQGCP